MSNIYSNLGGWTLIKRKFKHAEVAHAFGHVFIFTNSEKEDRILGIGKTEDLAVIRAERTVNDIISSQYTRLKKW